MYFRFGASNHLSGIHSNSLSMRILKKKQTITVQYGLETALAFALAFAHTSMRNQRKGSNQRKETEALQTDVNDILYVLLSKMGYWYAFTVIPSKLSLCE